MVKNAALRFLLALVAGCGHEHESWPMRLPGEAMAHRTCLECGHRRPYSLLDAKNRLLAEAPLRRWITCTAPSSARSGSGN